MSFKNIQFSLIPLCGALALSGISIANAAGMHSDGHGHGAMATQSAEGHGGHALPFGAPPAKGVKADRTIHIVATDNRFDLPSLKVKAGETLRFVIENRGQLLHEFNLGSPKMHREHQKQMATMMSHGMLTPTGISTSKHGMAMDHDDPNSVLVSPGQTAEILWTFNAAKGLEFACNLPGHYQAGMMGEIDVVPDKQVKVKH